jgi:hypothetical protein
LLQASSLLFFLPIAVSVVPHFFKFPGFLFGKTACWRHDRQTVADAALSEKLSVALKDPTTIADRNILLVNEV